MGVYDEIRVPCPECGLIYHAQSKSGACEMRVYDLVDAPADVLHDVNRHAPFICPRCGEAFYVKHIVIGKPEKCEAGEDRDPLKSLLHETLARVRDDRRSS